MLVLVLVALLCVGGIITAEEEADVQTVIRRLNVIAGELQDDITGVGNQIKNKINKLEYDIEDIGEGIEDMETEMENVTAEVVNLREEVKTTRSVLQTGQQDIGQNMTQLVDEVEDLKRELHMHHQDIGWKITQLQEHHYEELEYLKASTVQQEDLKTKTESLEKELGEVKHYTLVLTNRTETELEEIKGELVNLRNDLESKLDSREGPQEAIAGLTENYVEVKEELASLQRDMNSTLYILQMIQDQLNTMRQDNLNEHQQLLPGSCSELHPNSPSGYYWLRGVSNSVYCDMDRNTLRASCSQLHSTSLSGYYWLRGLSERVYCDTDRQSCGCGNPWGWMRVADINMTDPNQQCPEGFRLRPETSMRMCVRTEDSRGCTSIVFPTHSVQYNRVCGMVKAYQFGNVNAFGQYYWQGPHTIDDLYADGVSITHGQSPRKHIWTFSPALDETRSDRDTCPCTKNDTSYTGVVPPFIGNDYFCDTGSRQHWEPRRLYTEDPLWDGEGCGPTSSCCQFNSPPWFCKTLPQLTTDDIEVRVCIDENQSWEAIPFERMELYVQ